MDDAPRRTLPRLRGFDYSSANGYFVTVCTSDREPRFGRVEGGVVNPTPAGEMVVETWLALPDQFPTVLVDAFVAMPDHLRGVLVLGTDPLGDPEKQPTLGKVMQWFKTVTTNQYIRGVYQQGWPPFNKKLWQRYYNDHIIRNDADLERIRSYIEANPVRWSEKRDRS